MSIKIKLSGFEELYTKIQKSGGSIDNAAKKCMEQSATIFERELKTQMRKAEVETKLIDAMAEPKVFQDGNAFVAKVGYKKGSYDPENPSDGYKVVFLNYGTPHRRIHGKVKARGFIQKARKKAKPQIKRQQEETLNDIISRLKR